MYMVLAKEVANVDTSCFEKIGAVQSDCVRAVPTVDQFIALKGQAAHPIDDVVDCQNTLFLHFEVPSSNFIGDPDFDNVTMKPGALYRYRGDNEEYQGREFVELKYETSIGVLTLSAYFLVPIVDCEFAIMGSIDEAIKPCTAEELWREGHIRLIKW
jgi:hypothetical protein